MSGLAVEWDRHKEGFADYGGEAVERLKEGGGQGGNGLEMLQYLGVVPGGFAGGAGAPGGDGVFDAGGGRKDISEQADVQGVFGDFDEAV